jgi:hypothetical protein
MLSRFFVLCIWVALSVVEAKGNPLDDCTLQSMVRCKVGCSCKIRPGGLSRKNLRDYSTGGAIGAGNQGRHRERRA